MKAVIIIVGLSIGIFLGLYGGTDKSKPKWWKVLAIFIISCSIILTIMPPVAGTFEDAAYMSKFNKDFTLDVKMLINPNTAVFNNESKEWLIDANETIQGNNDLYKLSLLNKTIPDEFKSGKPIIAKVKYDSNRNLFVYLSTQYVNPIITIPFVYSLGERIRILNFHVPVAWISVLAYLVSMIFSIQYLRTRDLKYDLKSSASASLGTMFCLLATSTGMIWAKFNWGSFWNWDPRETSIFVLLMIYAAYFALRMAIDKEELRARLSSVYSIIAFCTVPIFIFVLPRITSGLHPGSSGDNSGPILSSKSEMLNFTKQITFSIALASFTILYFWMLNLIIRIKNLNYIKNIS